jgi:hypothetical protein
MIALDTFALLRSIAGAPETFAAVEDDLERAAVASIKKLLKAKGLTIDYLRSLSQVLGPDSLGFILGHDSVKDKEITALVKKLDKHWPPLASARVEIQRDHLIDLATGAARPTDPPPPPARNRVPRSPAKKAVAKPKKTVGWSSAMGASPQKNH